uniref:Uncharacterized protein n=1 Tax=Pararge aegeria TaxID=116150 RepID=S4P024_9NEOP
MLMVLHSSFYCLETFKNSCESTFVLSRYVHQSIVVLPRYAVTSYSQILCNYAENKIISDDNLKANGDSKLDS